MYIKSKANFSFTPNLISLPGVITVISLVCTFPELSECTYIYKYIHTYIVLFYGFLFT